MVSAQGVTLLVPVLILLLLCSAFFSGSETALMAISRLRLKHLARTNPSRVKTVEKVLRKPEQLIGTILLGNNLVNVAMSAIATFLAVSVWGEAGIVYVTAVLTLVILIFAETTPKVYAKYFAERVSFLSAPVLEVLMLVFRPVVATATFVAVKTLLLFGADVSKASKPLLTEDKIKTVIKAGSDEGAISQSDGHSVTAPNYSFPSASLSIFSSLV